MRGVAVLGEDGLDLVAGGVGVPEQGGVGDGRHRGPRQVGGVLGAAVASGLTSTVDTLSLPRNHSRREAARRDAP
ncbi:MAG: hypothetical protein ACRDRU_28735 [Pseudonocardiaceae bacterium]